MYRATREVVKKNGLFTVRLTLRVYPPPNKSLYILVAKGPHFIMEKIGPKFSHLLTVRAKGADPPSPPLWSA